MPAIPVTDALLDAEGYFPDTEPDGTLRVYHYQATDGRDVWLCGGCATEAFEEGKTVTIDADADPATDAYCSNCCAVIKTT
jgi:hypothetical protein